MNIKSHKHKDVYTNFFGKVIPSYDSKRLIEVFGIKHTDRVIDIGGGNKPLERGDVIVDIDPVEGVHRNGAGIPAHMKKRYIIADIHNLPFTEKYFDFVFCSHVLEHVSSPEKACHEIIRVGKRGYIETPRDWIEIVAGYPSHQWLVDVCDNELIFKRRPFIESPYLNSLLFAVWRSKRLEEYALKRFLNISCIQFYWENEFKFKVIDSPEDSFDYSNPFYAAMSHFYFARNILLFEAPYKQGIFHAERAMMLCPDVESFQVLCTIYALLLNRDDLWSKTSKLLLKRGIIKNRDIILLKMGFKKRVIERLKRYIEEHDPSEEI